MDEIKKRGRPKKGEEKKESDKKYILTYKDVKHECATFDEMSKIANKSASCLYRIYKDNVKFKKNTSDKLKDIKIEKIKNNNASYKTIRIQIEYINDSKKVGELDIEV